MLRDNPAHIRKSILFLSLIAYAFPGIAQRAPVLENDAYKLAVLDVNGDGPSIRVERLDGATAQSLLVPELSVFFSEEDPSYRRGFITEGRSRIAAWKSGDEQDLINCWKIGAWTRMRAVKASLESPREISFGFDDPRLFSLELTLALGEGNAPPILTWTLNAGADGWYAVAFTGLQEQVPEELDFLYQPLVWSWKRFPAAPVLTPEAYCTTAAALTSSKEVCEGIAVDPSEIPYRFATFDNSRFGIALRTLEGLARPMVVAPIPGGAESYMRAGSRHQFSCRYFLAHGDWKTGTEYLLSEIIGFRTERQNAAVTLNRTLENMIDFAMDDVYSGWVAELKGCDYRFDVPGTVKNVSALHPLSIALTTGNLEIYRRRALPMIEYVLSREKYLYAVNDQIKKQNPSHFLKGPCVEISELAALHQMTGGENSVFAAETERIFGKARQLNLVTETGGGSWQDYLARYRISGKTPDLDKAVELAHAYLDASYSEYPRDFTTSAGLKDAQATFVTDYTLSWNDLFELYEETSVERFLEAAHAGAWQLLLWMRTNPMAPDTLIRANPGGRVPGVFPGRRYKPDSYEWKEYDTSTEIQEQDVPAWRTSLAGLLPEQPGTYVYGPIMLSHHAAWMLRLSHLTGKDLYKDAAYNTIIGRYANFPGYYFTSLNTTVYQQPDYPLHPYLDIKYNAIFYNHIWPHIALLQDFLVSDAYMKSNGQVTFPSAYAPGYAFLTSKVYGHRPGEVFGNEDVRLWLPGDAIRSSTIALNHVFGRTDEDTYLVLMNSSPETVAADLYLHPDIIKWNKGQQYEMITYQVDGQTKHGLFMDGQLRVEVPGDGLIAVKFVGLRNDVPLHNKLGEIQNTRGAKDYFREVHENNALGTITGMLIDLVPDFTDAYIYTDATEKQVRKVILKYMVEGGAWEEIADAAYPYEFSIHLEEPRKALRLQWFAEDPEGATHKTEIFELRN